MNGNFLTPLHPNIGLNFFRFPNFCINPKVLKRGKQAITMAYIVQWKVYLSTIHEFFSSIERERKKKSSFNNNLTIHYRRKASLLFLRYVWTFLSVNETLVFDRTTLCFNPIPRIPVNVSASFTFFFSADSRIKEKKRRRYSGSFLRPLQCSTMFC